MDKQEQYMISGSDFRLLVFDLYSLFAQYVSLSKRITEAKNEKDFIRLKKMASGYERMAHRLCRRWGIPEDRETIACDTMENAIMEQRLTPLIPAPPSEDTEIVPAFLDVMEELIAKSKAVTADMEAALAELDASADPFGYGSYDE